LRINSSWFGFSIRLELGIQICQTC
jgi:hypothetical protein